MADEQGTGKHPHKSTEEPYPHHKGSDQGSRSKQASAGAGGHGSERSEQGGSEESNSSDLKEREYKDAQGNVHHHTRTYEEQHGKK